jgi:hypothetical protein
MWTNPYLSGRVPASAAPAGLSVRHLGRRSSALPYGSEDLARGVRFIEQGVEPDPKAKKKRAQMLARALRKLGYEVTITPINLAIAENGMQI